MRYAGMIVAWNGISVQDSSSTMTDRRPMNGSVSA